MKLINIVLYGGIMILVHSCGRSRPSADLKINIDSTLNDSVANITTIDTVIPIGNKKLYITEIIDSNEVLRSQQLIKKNFTPLNILTDSTRVQQNSDGLIFNLSNYEKYFLVNSIEGDTTSDIYEVITYSNEGYLPDLGAWLVYKNISASGTCASSNYLLVDIDDGEEFYISHDLVLSPEGKYFYTFENDALSGFSLILYEVINKQVKELKYVNDYPFSNIAVDECSNIEGWINTSTLLLQVDCVFEDEPANHIHYLKLEIK